MMTGDDNLAYNERIERLRSHEYPMLKDEVYLDHAGTTLCSKSLVDKFAADMTANLFGNPHSASASSQASLGRIEDIRLHVLRFFNADPSEFDLVFVANATAAAKLVAEAFRGLAGGFDYLYHETCHTSLIGVRQEARNSFCLNDENMQDWLTGNPPLASMKAHDQPTLFAYPAQSNMTGRKLPLDWSWKCRKFSSDASTHVYTLLDAASFVSTSPLDLSDSEHAPDFVTLSFYKIFGFPDLGGLIVRRHAAPIFQHRRYFGGGTVDVVSCVKEQWHAPKAQALHESLEDGTLPIHSIAALGSALEVHRNLFGSMADVNSHTTFLGRRLHDGLSGLRHSNGREVCVLYSDRPRSTETEVANGPVVAFNLQNHLGAWISPAEFEKLASLKQFHIRTGGVCNPGGIASALCLEPWEIRRNFSAGFRCANDNDIMSGKPTGVIRVSVGAMSTTSDVDRFVAFLDEFYRTQADSSSVVHESLSAPQVTPDLYVDTIMIYPVKSCGGFRISPGLDWEVRPEGLAWDREWCLVHQGTGQALSQKRYPRMALVRPAIDFPNGRLRVSYVGPRIEGVHAEISVPLSADPSFFRNPASRSLASRVCGEEVSTQMYASHEINDFFSQVLAVPCALARFPPGGVGKSMRHAKAHLQNHQKPSLGMRSNLPTRPSGVVGVSTPPDSDSETEKPKILLSNESPVLAINLSSLEALNRRITEQGGEAVSPEVFRANIVIGSSSTASTSFAYSEDHWSRLRVGKQNFQMLGSCRRCHMVCINQETANKSDEPFVTLSKTRRFEGKVFFGTHMCHVPTSTVASRDDQFPTVQVGDSVVVDPA
ncbi:PLP-dependent transferase [Xylariomycetidae sp. FL0641]|nr:PLP-dependent transferase [Xylariomycetidae sp. FL0641]